MINFLIILEIIVAALLVVLVLIQSGDAGLAGVWTGGGETYHSKRGVEKIVFIATIVAAALFSFIAATILFLHAATLPPSEEPESSDIIEGEELFLDASASADLLATPEAEVAAEEMGIEVE